MVAVFWQLVLVFVGFIKYSIIVMVVIQTTIFSFKIFTFGIFSYFNNEAFHQSFSCQNV